VEAKGNTNFLDQKKENLANNLRLYNLKLDKARVQDQNQVNHQIIIKEVDQDNQPVDKIILKHLQLLKHK
jgi:hypothetical protein